MLVVRDYGASSGPKTRTHLCPPHITYSPCPPHAAMDLLYIRPRNVTNGDATLFTAQLFAV